MDTDSYRQFGRLFCWGTFQPVRQRDIRRLERELGQRLPPAYVDFIRVANGGHLEYSVDLPPGGGGEPICFSRLYTITPNAAGDFSYGTVLGEKRQLPSTYYGPDLPGELLPIADDGGGSSLFLRLDPDHYGEVFAFVHGLPAWAGDTEHDSAGHVAQGFDAYLDLLYVEDNQAEEIWRDAQGDGEWLAVVERWLDGDVPGWRDRTWARPLE